MEKRAWGFWQVRGKEGQRWLRDAGCFAFIYESQVQGFVNLCKRQPKFYFPPGLVMLPKDTMGALTRRQSQFLWLFCSPLLCSLRKIAELSFAPIACMVGLCSFVWKASVASGWTDITLACNGWIARNWLAAFSGWFSALIPSLPALSPLCVAFFLLILLIYEFVLPSPASWACNDCWRDVCCSPGPDQWIPDGCGWRARGWAVCLSHTSTRSGWPSVGLAAWLRFWHRKSCCTCANLHWMDFICCPSI